MKCKYVYTLIIFKCPECGKSTTQKSFKKHRKVIHLKKEKGENDNSERNEMSHIRREERVSTEIDCPECAKNMTKKHLKRRIEVIHLKKEKGENAQRGEKAGGHLAEQNI